MRRKPFSFTIRRQRLAKEARGCNRGSIAPPEAGKTALNISLLLKHAAQTALEDKWQQV